MGFKYQKFLITAGGTDYPTGTTEANIRTKEEYILTHFVQALIDCDCGWNLDTTRNATITNFFAVKKKISTTDAPGLFLVNSTSGCKLFVSYITDRMDGGIAFLDNGTKVFKEDFVCSIYHSSRPTNKTSIQGLIMSMIPEGSTNNFGSTCDTTFLPLDATRLYGSASSVAYDTNQGELCTIANRLYSNGNTCFIQVFATPYCVGIGASTLVGGTYLYPLYFCGRIMGELFTSSDNTKQSKYGTFTIRRSKGDTSPSYDYISDIQYYYHNSGQSTMIGGSVSVLGAAPGTAFTYSISYNYSSPYVYSPFSGNCVCKADGTWISNTSTHGIAACVNTMMCSTQAYDGTSNIRPWQPIAFCVFSQDMGVDGIISCVGLKGYLDTDLFRCSPQFTQGTVIDNGNFVCTGDVCLTLGWDPSNIAW